jgi:hypothetical protein
LSASLQPVAFGLEKVYMPSYKTKHIRGKDETKDEHKTQHDTTKAT